jgi:biotin operon repressor
MKNDLKHKLYMGFGGLRMRIPLVLSQIGAKKGTKGAKANADCLSKEERRVHHFIVMKMAVVKDPITADLIANELGISNDQVNEIINKLENLKTFIFRGDGKGINWAYPLSLENTGLKMTASSGEQFFAA